jgi:hypothetical protein
MQVRRVLSLSIQAVHLLASCFPHVLRMGLSAPAELSDKGRPIENRKIVSYPVHGVLFSLRLLLLRPVHRFSLKAQRVPSPGGVGVGGERAFSEHRMVLLLRPFPLPSTLTLKSVTPDHVVWYHIVYIDVMLTPVIINTGLQRIVSLGGRLSCCSRGYSH